ncbi:flagellar assembly protein FliH [Uliginosibacterium sp. H3]|uniref:Flagellar assembly protein FliH n=1 Tax=Uliginosibacterium silvisoli TaxID=3114758 RepID=A0ABU6K4W0_9RHOO|nr:flagellar assembly protein FliH [Uliginosibacterium sp. H3]
MASVIHNNQASGAYQRAEFVNFDRPARSSTSVEQKVSAAPEEPVDDRLELAPGITLPTAEEIDAMQQEAWKEGYASGYEEGSARGRLEAAELHQLLQSMHAALSNLDQEVAEEIQALALEVARQVVRDTLNVQPESVIAVIREALTQVPQQGATVRVNPLDAALVHQYLGEQFGTTGHRLREDEAVERGGCLIESEGGQIDAQISTRWRRVVENISRSAAQFAEE